MGFLSHPLSQARRPLTQFTQTVTGCLGAVKHSRQQEEKAEQSQGPVDSPRAEGISRYADLPEAPAVIRTLEEIAAARGASMGAIALAWCRAHPRIPSVIASARNTEQRDQLLPMMEVELTDDEMKLLNEALQ